MANFLLVHGGWIGAWSWRRVRPLLLAAGHQAFTPTLTGLGERAHLLSPDIGLTTHIQDVVGVIESEELQDVVLVGQSYAGMVITGVADRVAGRLSQLVYLDAFVPRDGESLADLVAPEMMASLQQAARSEGNSWRVPPLPPQACGVSEEQDVQWMLRRMGFHPLKTMLEPLHLTLQKCTVPKTFIYCNRPAMGLFEGFVARARAEKWNCYELATGHTSMVTAPRELASILLKIVN